MVLGLGLLAIVVSAAAQTEPVTLPQVQATPVIDGRGDDLIWQHVPSIRLDHALRTKKKGEKIPPTTVRLCRSDDALYLLYTCQERHYSPGHEVVGLQDSQVWWMDCVTLALAPDSDRPQLCYNIYVARNGLIRDEYFGPGLDLSWDAHLTVGVERSDEQWTVELKLPLSALTKCPMAGDQWKANFGRIRHQGLGIQVASWQPASGSWMEPDHFGSITLPGVSTVPAVHQQNLEIIEQRTRAFADDCTRWQNELAKSARFAFSQQVVQRLQQCVSRFQQNEDPLQVLPVLREAEQTLPRQAQVARVIEATGKQLTVLPLSSMVKLRADELPSEIPAPRVDLSAAKGEAESRQLLLVSDEPLASVNVTVTPLTLKGGEATIKPEVRCVGYVPVRHPTPGGDGMPGLWPDPLFENEAISLSPEHNGSYLLTCWVPANATAGQYSGTLTVTGGQHEVKLPVHLTVYDVTLPALSRLRTDFTTSEDRTLQHLVLRYRMCPAPTLSWEGIFSQDEQGKWIASWETFDKDVQTWLDSGATTFRINNILGRGTHLPDKADGGRISAQLQLLDKHLTDKGWSDRFFFYTFDEPSSAELSDIRQLCAFVHKHGPHLQVMLTFFDPGLWLLQDSIDIWVPESFMLYPFVADYLQVRGKQVWTYVCIGNTGLSYPDIWKIDWTGAAPRAMGWWLWKYHCEGFLYWRTDAWLWADPYKDTIGFPLGNGDGYLFYPKPHTESDLPAIPSLRAELTRDGFEDYDLLTMLQDRVHAIAAKDTIDDVSQQWLGNARHCLDASVLIPAMAQFDRDPDAYDQRHLQLLQLLAQPLK